MDLQLTSESKRGYTVSLNSRWIIVCVIANCQMSVNPYFQYSYIIVSIILLLQSDLWWVWNKDLLDM